MKGLTGNIFPIFTAVNNSYLEPSSILNGLLYTELGRTVCQHTLTLPCRDDDLTTTRSRDELQMAITLFLKELLQQTLARL